MRTTALLLLLTLTATINAEIYRWRDSSGQLHFGDRPTSGAEQVTLPGIDLERSRYPLDKVIDGDTIRLKDGRSVRLLGINAPEVAHHNSPAQSGGDAAREALVALLPEKSVILEFDRERHDHYDRLLAHLFNDDGENINSKLLRQGIVYQVARPPNLKYADDYRSAEQQARREQLGIWMLDEYQLTPASGADKFRNSFRRLTTQLISIKKRRKYSEVEFEGPLTARIENSLLEQLMAAVPGLRQPGTPLVIRGWVGTRSGIPSIKITHASQFESTQ